MTTIEFLLAPLKNNPFKGGPRSGRHCCQIGAYAMLDDCFSHITAQGPARFAHANVFQLRYKSLWKLLKKTLTNWGLYRNV